MVDVAHDGDHGGARQEVGRVVVEREGVLLLLGHDLDLAAQVVGHELDELVGHRLGHGERGAEQEEALDDVGGRDVEEVGELGHGGALRHLHDVELGDVLVVGQGLLDGLLLGRLGGLGLPVFLALLAAAGGLAAGLLHGGAGVLEDALAVVLLGGAGHAAVAVLVRALVAVVTLVVAVGCGGLLGRGGHVHGGRPATVLAAAAAAVLRTGRALGLVLLAALGLLLLLLLEHLLLLGDLLEQAGELGHALGRGVLHAVALGLLGAAALLLGGLGLLRGAAGLLLGAAALLLGALALAALLDLAADGLLLGAAGLLLCPTGGLLGLLGGAELLLAGLELGGELLAHHGDVGVLQGRRRGLRRDLHVLEMGEHLLARDAELLGEFADARLCHAT